MNLRRLAALYAAFIVIPAATFANPVMFVTVTPSTGDTISGTFQHFVSFVGNHLGKATRAPRGGDLWIRYDNGVMRNLTQEAGFGNEICVREANIHWSGQKAIFSMAVGGLGASPTPTFFQLYEVTGFMPGQTVQITKLNQLANYNHIQPTYCSDGSIIFGSDRPPTGNPAHYPNLDEYESTPVVSGLWKMNADGTGLHILDHNPSGDFTPIIDSFGRIIFTRWDHLKRDQQADLWIDGMITDGDTSRATPLTFTDENSSTFAVVQYGDEVFPENGRLHPDVNGNDNEDGIPHPYWDQDFVPGTAKQDFNFFTPWMIMQDGTEAELVNHIGRHEMFNYVETSNSALPDFFKSSPYSFRNSHQMREDPNVPGRYYFIDAAEFGTHGAGRMLRFDAPPGLNADNIAATIQAVSPSTDANWNANIKQTHFRDPMPRTDGTLWASVNGTPDFAANTATNGSSGPYIMSSNYAFKIRKLVPNGEGFFEPAEELVPGGIVETVEYASEAFWPPRNVKYVGPMWELFPVEVVARTAPNPHEIALPAIEQGMLNQRLGGPAGVAAFKSWLQTENLALVVSRDVTVRADKQQLYNLKVKWSDHASAAVGSTPAEIGYLQFFSAQFLRAYTHDDTNSTALPGRRPIAREINMATSQNPPQGAGAPEGGIRIGDDGSMAAFLPAGRALTWQLTEDDGSPLVRERYWLSFQPGEIRACTNCHGVNQTDVFGHPAPTNEPEALGELLDWWNAQFGAGVKDWQSLETTK